MDGIRGTAGPWAHLDTLHRESLDELLTRHGLDPTGPHCAHPVHG